jgi:AcrR family transcriptional regulator
MSAAEDKAPVRRRILDAAAQMFYRDGVRAVGVDAIVARCGVAKMSLYRNFPSKAALVAAWLADRDAAFWRRWQRAEAAHAGDPRAQLEAILDMVAARVADPRWRGCPFLNTGTEFREARHPAQAVIRANKAAVRARLSALAAAAGARDPDLLAQQLQLLIDGAYAIGQSLGPQGPAKTVAGAGRVLIAAQLAASRTAS